MRLIKVSQHPSAHKILWQILSEREPRVNISHKEMPSWEDHVLFINSKPYDAWYILECDDEPVGSIYLTKHNEIGVSILKAHQRRGFAKKAIDLLIKFRPRKRFLANINPQNARSIQLFENLGFRHIQNTYELSSDLPDAAALGTAS